MNLPKFSCWFDTILMSQENLLFLWLDNHKPGTLDRETLGLNLLCIVIQVLYAYLSFLCPPLFRSPLITLVQKFMKILNCRNRKYISIRLIVYSLFFLSDIFLLK